MAGTTLKLNVQGLDPQASDPQQQIPQAPPPPPPPLNFAQFASNPLAQQKVSAMVPGLASPPPAPATPPRPPSPIATMAVQNPRGLVAPGNLPIWNRPVVQNADGTHSSEYSTSFQDENGREVLVPTVVGGKFLTPDGAKPPEGSPAEQAMFQQAWQHYLKTGENLGAFDNPDNADAYSMALHNRGPAPNYPFSPTPSQPQSQVATNSPAATNSLPTLQDRLSQAAQPPMQSMSDWQQANPGQQEQKYSGIQKALQIAAGIIHGGAPGGVAAGQAIHQHDLPAGLQGIDQQRYQQQVVQPYQTQQGIADTQAQMVQRQALADKASSQADEYSPQTLTAQQAAALGNPALEGTQMNARDLARLLGTHETNVTSAANTKAKTDASITNTNTKADASITNTNTRADVAAAADKTKRLLGTLRANVSTANSQRAHPGTGGNQNFKVPADVTKRAALANNVNENAGAVEQVLNRRPDIVGATGGRYSNVQDMIGSNDPDIAELGVRMHNIALASNGAHGLRSAEAVQKTEDELFKNFKRGPDGIRSALQATRGSMQTFLDDEQNFESTGRRTPSANNGTPSTSGNGGYTKTATGPGNHKIGLKGGKWYDVQTGAPVQ